MEITMKKTRVILGLTQSQLAELMGTSQARIADVEREKSTRTETKKDRQFLKALLVLYRNDLIQEFQEFKV